ncbi:MAG: hypothetical protein PVH12_05445 [Candidatus Bathyarchaeota archaeon]|jgi:hypothetical protein
MKIKISGKIGKLDPLKIKVLRFIGLSEKEPSVSSEAGIAASSTEPATPFTDYSIETAKAQTSAHAYWMTLDRPR